MLKMRWLFALSSFSFLFTLVFGITTLPAHAFTSSDADTAMQTYVNTFYDSNAKYFYYDTSHSKYNDFWKEAISWDIVMDAYQRTNSATYRQMIDDVYDGFMARNSDMSTACNTSNSFTLSNNYNDDIGWWAKASIRAYEITGESRYENCAKRLFDSIYAYWDTSTYGGGIWWTRTNPTQKNVATNAPAAITAAKLAVDLPDNSYLSKAEAIYSWVKSTLTNGSGTVYDDYDSGTLHTWQFTYNYGTFIGAADALYHDTNTSSYLTDAENAANTSMTAVTQNGILQDEGTGDGGGFKGIYARYVAELATTYHQSQYLSFLQKNATVAWSNRRSPDNLINTNWTTEAPSGTIETHAAGSAVAILQDVPVDNITAYQAENGTLHSLSTEAIYSGYHGTGYVAGWNKDGQWVDFSVSVPTSGAYRLILRYAGGAGNASRYIYANGKGVVNNLSFPGTGSWSSYSTVTVYNVNLNAGSNTISVIYNSSLGSKNWLNLDELTVVAQ
ncbi:glycoside hydrolase family 76 protein [Dictyobacter formicarum]|uniref:CBM6 domain-containing protein n=1 Tax=Dictyobacter formicarum TaxID=2778368 RepID=A0ABQ3VQY4_9CHLR|nr:glycoside hydrolase family 76 protein [Dictyobacter formicarum]GHO87511.1 hypothetical protein KSZ_55170 [Dictyobacter formicarum]